jgi:hypothetical protein
VEAVTDREGLIAFLAARYDEAEAMARAAGGGDGLEGLTWRQHDADDAPGRIVDGHGHVIVYDEGSPGYAEAAHIVSVDPKHRLADIALKRAILAEHKHVETGGLAPAFGCRICHADRDYGINGEGWCATVRQLGAEFADHPDYDESWKP